MKDNTYFNESVDTDGISGDDVNRRLREKRLGFKAPSDDWFLAKAPIHCIFKGQVPTKTLHDVVLYNFLPLAIIGFVATDDFGPVVPGETPEAEVEMVDSIDESNGTVTQIPVVEGCDTETCDHLEDGECRCACLELIPPTTEVDCDRLIAEGKCPGCDVMEGKCPELCADPPDLCEDLPNWAGQADQGSAFVDTLPDESMYQQGTFVALQNRFHDLRSQWSLIAVSCKDQDVEQGCTHFGQDVSCHFDNCPRIHGK